MLRIATLLRNSRNPANTANPAYLQANLLLAGVWRARPEQFACKHALLYTFDPGIIFINPSISYIT